MHLPTDSPNSDITPQATHTTKDIPTLPECCRMPFGEMKIPAPMMVPMMMEIPRSSVTFFPSSTFLPFSSCASPLTLCPFLLICPSLWSSADFFVILRGGEKKNPIPDTDKHFHLGSIQLVPLDCVTCKTGSSTDFESGLPPLLSLYCTLSLSFIHDPSLILRCNAPRECTCAPDLTQTVFSPFSSLLCFQISCCLMPWFQ